MIATCTHCQARYQLEADKVPQRVIKVRCPSCTGVFSLDGTRREESAAAVDFPSPFETTSNDSPFSASQESPFDEPAAAATQDSPDFPAPETPETPEVPETPLAQENPFPEPGNVSFDDTPSPLASATTEEPVTTGNEFSTPETVDTPEVEITSEPAASVEAPAPAFGAESALEPASASPSVATLDEAPSPSPRRRRCKEEMLARALVSDILVYNRETRDSALAEGTLLEALGGEIKKSWELYKEKVTPEVANSTTYFREALNEILAEGQSVF